MEVKYGFTVNLENNFQQMNMMMNMTSEKDTYIRVVPLSEDNAGH